MDTQEDIDQESMRAVRVSVRGTGNFTSGRDMHIGGPMPPAPGHPQALACPQCRSTTWRGTQLCIHCHYDVGTWLSAIAAQRRRSVQVVRLQKMMCWCVVAASLFFASSQFAAGLFQMFLIGLSGVFGLGAFKALESWVNLR